MNKIQYNIFSYNNYYLNGIKKRLYNKIIKLTSLKILNTILYLKWQFINRLNTQQLRQYKKKMYTFLRSPFVNKESREQFSIKFFVTALDLVSIFNTKYKLSIYNLHDLFFFINKQFYLRIKKKNCYFFKN